MVSWRHVNLLGEYDFSDENLQDRVGIRLPKTLRRNEGKSGREITG